MHRWELLPLANFWLCNAHMVRIERGSSPCLINTQLEAKTLHIRVFQPKEVASLSDFQCYSLHEIIPVDITKDHHWEKTSHAKNCQNVHMPPPTKDNAIHYRVLVNSPFQCPSHQSPSRSLAVERLPEGVAGDALHPLGKASSS